MNMLSPRLPFKPLPPDAAGVISWVHIGDLHMTKACEQNHLDLAEIVSELNRAFADSASFVFLPGDVADDGGRSAYAVVRQELDRLRLPWCAILGDHDVHEESFANFLEAMSDRTHYAFTIGKVKFIAMNAFDLPHPASFTVGADQLAWLESELQSASGAGQSKILLLHCYPSDLKVGGDQLMKLIGRFDVRLVDMGHTHYNEVSNDGLTLYSATRSSGQIEEGSVGYSVTNVDGDVVSWKFVELGTLPAAVITSPSDDRFLRDASAPLQRKFTVRAKFFAEALAASATAQIGDQVSPMKRVHGSLVWEAELSAPRDGSHTLMVRFEDAQGHTATDEIRVAIGRRPERKRAERDQDNALEAWPEHGLLGTQLGPNKNGKKW